MANDRSAARSSGQTTMAASPHEPRKPRREHSVPWFWPLAAAMEFGEEGMQLFQDNLKFLAEAQVINGATVPLTLDRDIQIGLCVVEEGGTHLTMKFAGFELPPHEIWHSGRAFKVLEDSVDYGFYGTPSEES